MTILESIRNFRLKKWIAGFMIAFSMAVSEPASANLSKDTIIAVQSLNDFDGKKSSKEFQKLLLQVCRKLSKDIKQEFDSGKIFMAQDNLHYLRRAHSKLDSNGRAQVKGELDKLLAINQVRITEAESFIGVKNFGQNGTFSIKRNDCSISVRVRDSKIEYSIDHFPRGEEYYRLLAKKNKWSVKLVQIMEKVIVMHGDQRGSGPIGGIVKVR